MGEKTKRTNDLYCRDMPSARAIEEIKHLAAVKRVKVGAIVHREHNLARHLRHIAAGDGVLVLGDDMPKTIAALLAQFGID